MKTNFLPRLQYSLQEESDAPTLLGIDSHQHFWKYEEEKHSWIDDEMAVIRKDFLPEDLGPNLQENEIEGCVAVQADQAEDETDFLVSLATENSFIKGVVGWVDLSATNIEERLAHFAEQKIIKGFRHVLQGEEPSFMLQPSFFNGISKLEKYGFTYDILIFPKHLDAALQLAQSFPNQAFVVDHIAKPFIKAKQIGDWEKGIKALAACKNVSCKISGMVTEADFKAWKNEDFTPYLDIVVEAFGTKRIMYGSDWPVCEVAANYYNMMSIVKHYFDNYSDTEKQLFFRENAISFYHL